MLYFTYLWRNLSRNLLRSCLTCAAVAFPIIICVLSVAVIQGIGRVLDASAKQLRLAVTNKSSIINPMPGGYRAKVESLDPEKKRLVSVCGMRWIGGQVENSSTPLSTLAVDADTFAATYQEYEFTPEEIAAWERNRKALVVGRGTAEQFGWKSGDRVTIRVSVPPYSDMEFDVISTAPKAVDTITLFCRRDYVEEVLKVPGVENWINLLLVKCVSPEDMDYFRTAIDQLFANSMEETKTQDEKVFMMEFITQQFNLPRNLTLLATVTVFVAVMAAANTMSMNFRDRLSEFATLRSIGFRGFMLFTLTQTESMLLCTAGGLFGALLPYVVFMHTPLREYNIPVIQHLEIPLLMCAQAMLISLFIGITAAAWPSWQVLRMNVISALRNLE